MNTEYIYLLVDEVSIKGEITTSHHAFSTEKKAKQALADLKSHYDKIFEERGFLSDGVDEMNETSAYDSFEGNEHYYFINIKKLPIDSELILWTFFKK